MGKLWGLYILSLWVMAMPCLALDVQSTAIALRMRNTITGGLMPISDPLFASMVTKIQANDLVGAAQLAANSKYFAKYFARRFALQMQTPALDVTGITDNDATAFLIAHFVGTPTSGPSLSTIWAESATYLPVITGGAVHAADLSAADLEAIDWTQQARSGGQQDVTKAFIPVQHVGGYTTLSDRPNDNSYAEFGATAGTNLRMIEGIWEIATGLGLLDVASQAAVPQQVPRFVPEYDPNFFQGQGQTACIACHGGGMTSLNHGYAAVANVFDFNGNGFTYIPNPTVSTMKSLGSNAGKRAQVEACDLTRVPTPVCNPDSPDVNKNYSWDVSMAWEQSGTLKAMGWVGPTQGQGLQQLGYYLAQSWIVYQNFTQRVINELCPLGTFTTAQVNQIAAMANPWADPRGSDDIRTIVAQVAASSGCQ